MVLRLQATEIDGKYLLLYKMIAALKLVNTALHWEGMSLSMVLRLQATEIDGKYLLLYKMIAALKLVNTALHWKGMSLREQDRVLWYTNSGQYSPTLVQ